MINKDHAFVDGNKRTALLAAITLLGKNGYEFIGDPDETEHFTLEVAAVDTHAQGFEKHEYITQISRWFFRNSRKLITLRGRRKYLLVPPWYKRK